MFQAQKLRVIALIALLTLTPSAASADFIFNYVGSNFDTVESPFTTDDFIFGTVTFDSIGATTVSGFTLSTTIGGNPGFTFDVPDVTNLGGFTLISNTFDWAGMQTPQSWDLTIEGNVFGGIETETLSIIADPMFLNGDFADIDFGSSTTVAAASMSAGSFTAVPEPSSLVLVGTACALAGCGRHRRRRNSTLKQ